MMKQLEKLTGRIKSVHTEKIHIDEPFITTASRFAAIPGTVVLMSGGDLDSARYSLIATRPFLIFSGRCDAGRISCSGRTLTLKEDPFAVMRKLLACYRLSDPERGATPDHGNVKADGPNAAATDNDGISSVLPVLSGLFGYLAYDLKDAVEVLPATTMDDMALPHIYMAAPSVIIIRDHKHETTHLAVSERVVAGKSSLAGDLEFFKQALAAPAPAMQPFAAGETGFRSNFEKSDFMDRIVKIREYIRAGHVYQVNMSQRFESDFTGDAFSLFQILFADNPAPFFSYINAQDHFVVSTSPERFVQRTGDLVEARPIKGTKPRGKTPAEDLRYRETLVNSPKDDAELSMIVDLLRNDIGKVCRGGSVSVTAHKKVETYTNVHHLVSIVEGSLAPDKDSVDLIRATFPGGSITGCPKIRSMEIIDELETVNRHVYTGSMGYVSFHDTMDLSIAIRTATVHNNRIVFSVGGGIVYDSDPLDEYEETLHKGETLFKVFTGKKTGSGREQQVPYAWMNGGIRPLEKCCIPVSSPGFQYGFGFFETLRAEKGRVLRLDAHVKRFNRAWETLFQGPVPALSWGEIIRQVLDKNGLSQETAAVKIMASRGDRPLAPFNHTLCVTARPYTHRLETVQANALRVRVHEAPRYTPLADHKTMNYMYYARAGETAAGKGYHESLILNPDGSISETNTANIMIVRGNTVVLPVSPHVLDGIMQTAACAVFETSGFDIKKEKITLDSLRDNDRVILTNALMGAVPVSTIGERRFADATGICEKINAGLTPPQNSPCETLG